MSAENCLAIEYFQREEYGKIGLLLRDKDDQDRSAEHFLYYHGMLRWASEKLIRSTYETRLLKEPLAGNEAEEQPWWDLLVALFANKLGFFEEAGERAAAVMARCPLLHCAWGVLGWALSHQPDDATRSSLVKRVSAAIQTSQPHHHGLVALLATYLRGQWGLAEKYFVEVDTDNVGDVPFVPEDPVYPFWLQQMALIRCNRREYGEARRLLEEVGRLRPEHVEGMDTYSDILYLMGDTAQLAILDGRLGGRGGAVAWHVRGNLLSLRGDYAGAAVMFTRAARADPHHYRAWIVAAQQYLELRLPEAAIDCYLRATGTAGGDAAW